MRAPTPSHDEPPALGVAEGVLLWSMRSWATSSRHSIEPERRIARVLDRLGAREAPEYLFGFMFALLHGAVRPMRISCPCQPQVSADERALLDVFALAQEGQSFEAVLALRGFMTPVAAGAAYRSAQGVAGALVLAGWRLAPPASDSARRYGLVISHRPGAPDSVRASVLLH